MAGIKYLLQKEVFDATNERILSVCNVQKWHKKKRNSYLCIVAEAHSIPILVQVKQNAGIYRKKRTWQMSDIKTIDGRNDSTTEPIHEFDIVCEKSFKWFAANLHERQNFITVLYRQINKYIKVPENRAIFVNVPQIWLQEQSPEKIQHTDDMNNGSGSIVDEESDEFEDFQALTEKEEKELNKLISNSNLAITDAEQFMEQLSKKLQDLDGAQVQSVLASEKQVNALIEQIEAAIEEANLVEARFDEYDEILCHVRDTMEKMGEKNTMIEVANTNNIKLLNELEKLITQLDLPYQDALNKTDLKTPEGLKAAIDAGKALQTAMNCDIDAALLRLTAVQDQRKRFDKWKAQFSQTISRHLNNMFIHCANDLGESQLNAASSGSGELVLKIHSDVHKALYGQKDLMHWLKSMDRKAYDGLTKVYTNAMSKLYERELRQFFDFAKSSISLQLLNDNEMNTSISSKFKSPQSKQISQPYGILGISKEQWTNGLDANERQRFETIMEKVLTELEPVALSEQHFSIQFFQLDVLSPTTKNTQTTLDGIMSTSIGPCDGNDKEGVLEPQKKMDRQINEEVRRMMTSLFNILESELNSFINGFEKLDSFYSMYVLVRLTQHVMSAQDAHSFLSMTFASALVQVKRNFDKFMNIQLQSIIESKVPRRSKCGLLPYVENFEQFSNTAENIFRKTERRTDLDKWYIQLIDAIFEHIPVHASEHPKTPDQVVRMENFHHMHSLLAYLKISSLDEQKKIAKVKYNEALRAYVTKYFGRPLEKLNLFFDGVQQKVGQGVKETEISYQMAYSKQELRKVIGLYPAREVKKGLESLYKKVEKHLCEEENLLQVVWRAMQEEFIVQYKYLEEQITRCYANSMITLDFTIDDILNFFSEIAQSH
ncbi:exocyst complex component 1 [Contarinia nasturtii]|uniref:exocyst complex component 1 n=1 Tax=Contarinia nasturtii TaxID=265458 RepID=UPI0012D377A0|nr:exocyst complex component 1 [Contarinia nasturtii]